MVGDEVGVEETKNRGFHRTWLNMMPQLAQIQWYNSKRSLFGLVTFVKLKKMKLLRIT